MDKVFSVFSTVLAVTALGVALRPKAPTADVIKALTSGFASMQTAAFGPK